MYGKRGVPGLVEANLALPGGSCGLASLGLSALRADTDLQPEQSLPPKLPSLKLGAGGRRLPSRGPRPALHRALREADHRLSGGVQCLGGCGSPGTRYSRSSVGRCATGRQDRAYLHDSQPQRPGSRTSSSSAGPRWAAARCTCFPRS